MFLRYAVGSTVHAIAFTPSAFGGAARKTIAAEYRVQYTTHGGAGTHVPQHSVHTHTACRCDGRPDTDSHQPRACSRAAAMRGRLGVGTESSRRATHGGRVRALHDRPGASSGT